MIYLFIQYEIFISNKIEAKKNPWGQLITRTDNRRRGVCGAPVRTYCGMCTGIKQLHKSKTFFYNRKTSV